MENRGNSNTEKGGSRLGAARHQRILELIGRGEILAVVDLADRLGVSQETIRRDIRGLEEAGMLRRIHGGAAPSGPIDTAARRPVVERLSLDREAKAMAAVAALQIFDENMNIFIGGSSTMSLLANELAVRGPSMSVTTNMIDVASVLAATERFKVMLVAGTLNPATRTVNGPEMFRTLETRVFDMAVCGTSAIDLKHGFLGPTETHAAITSALRERSKRLAFVADVSKFSRVDTHIVQPLEGADILATDALPSEGAVSVLRERGIELVLPPASEHDSSKATEHET